MELIWRGGRAAEGARLESVYTVKRIEGSNPSLSASLLRSNLLGMIFQIIKPPFKPQYSKALAPFSRVTHAYVENRKITDFTPKSPFLFSVSPLHANVRLEGTHVQNP